MYIYVSIHCDNCKVNNRNTCQKNVFLYVFDWPTQLILNDCVGVEAEVEPGLTFWPDDPTIGLVPINE